MVIEARSSDEGLVVLRDTFFPGWTAEVDGRPAEVEPVHSVFRGVRVGPGQHKVELRYEPLSWRIGWVVSVVSLVALCLVAAMGVRSRRRAGR